MSIFGQIIPKLARTAPKITPLPHYNFDPTGRIFRILILGPQPSFPDWLHDLRRSIHLAFPTCLYMPLVYARQPRWTLPNDRSRYQAAFSFCASKSLGMFACSEYSSSFQRSKNRKSEMTGHKLGDVQVLEPDYQKFRVFLAILSAITLTIILVMGLMAYTLLHHPENNPVKDLQRKKKPYWYYAYLTMAFCVVAACAGIVESAIAGKPPVTAGLDVVGLCGPPAAALTITYVI